MKRANGVGATSCQQALTSLHFGPIVGLRHDISYATPRWAQGVRMARPLRMGHRDTEVGMSRRSVRVTMQGAK